MSKNRNASPTIFGFNYQIDIAICLLFRNVKNIDMIKIEGKHEDIEQILNDASTIYCQAKSYIKTKSKKDIRRSKLRSAISSLIDVSLNNNDSLLYCTNLDNPLIGEVSLMERNEVSEYKFKELNEETKEVIKKYFRQDEAKYNHFAIIKIPYPYCQDSETRQTFINAEIKKFLIKIKKDTSYYEDICLKLHQLLKDTAYGNCKVYFTKPNLVSFITLYFLDKKIDFSVIQDESILDKVEQRYNILSKRKILNFEISNNLLGIAESIRKEKPNISAEMIFKENKDKITKIIYGEISTDEICISTASIIFKTILRLRLDIDDIKKGCNYDN